MFLLSLQTGLIDMEMPHRLGAMSVILFIVAASLFQVLIQELLFHLSFLQKCDPSTNSAKCLQQFSIKEVDFNFSGEASREERVPSGLA